MAQDKLKAMWDQQFAFMRLLQQERDFPQFPVDLSEKKGQRFLKDITHECMGELFEANQHLKNSKKHRVTEVTEFEREKYIEELCDSLHYFFEICIASGISLDELYTAYMTKGEINVERIKGGY